MGTEDTNLERSGKTPVFRQIYLILLREINDGIYNSEKKLPSEKELCQRFGVERNTVRKALQILVNENRITRVPGIGTKLLEENRRGRETETGSEQRTDFAPQRGSQDYDSGLSGQNKNASRKISRIKQKNNIVLLITQVDYLHSHDNESFHYKLIHSFEKRLSRLGYNLLFKPIGQNGIVAETIRSAIPRGIIFDSYNPDSYYREAAGFGLPCVSVNHYTPLFTSIVSNNYEGAYRVTKELADAGHRRIAVITGKSSHQTNVERMNGVQTLCGSMGINLKNEYIISGDWTFGSGAEAAKKILGMKAAQRPTAVFAFNDDLAYGCYSALQAAGVSVPADISLAGFDKSDRYIGMFPPISTVDVNIQAIVDYSCWYLSSSLSGWTPEGKVKIHIDATFCDNGTIKNLN